MNLRTWGAWSAAGLALWASLGELDVTGTTTIVRVAMLPSPLLLLATVPLGWLAGWVMKLGNEPRVRTDSSLPLYALLVLVLPYLPWLPDAVPVFRVFAGPLRYVIWAGVIAQVVWSAFGSGRGRRVVVRVRTWSTSRLYGAVFAASLVCFGTAALVVAPTSLAPGGDEPHYLIITQSLLLDHDLDIENNHQRGDYRRYYAEPLEPHALARGVDGRLYSVHPIGLPVLLLPFFAVAGYPGAVIAMLLMASAAAALTWVWVRRAAGSVSAATFAWAAAALSVTYLFSAGTVYPEVAAALAVMLAVGIGLRTTPTAAPAPSLTRCVILSLSAASLPWLSSKYALVSAALIALGLWRIWRDTSLRGARVGRVMAVVVPWAVGIGAWLFSFQMLWGSPWPSAAYGGASQTQMSLWNLRRGVPGLLFDQEYGLLTYAPVLATAGLGLWHQWRARGVARDLAVTVLLVFGTLLTTVASHTMWWGGSSVPARFLASGTLLLALPVAWEYRRVAADAGRRAAYRLLLLVSLGATTAVLLSPGVSALANRRDGVSKLLAWLSPDWHLWAYAPDFIIGPGRIALVQAALTIVCTAAGALLLGRVGRRTSVGGVTRIGRGAAFLRADAALVVAVVLLTLVTPAVLRGALRPDVRPDERVRIGVLESFDPHARPLAIRYDPFTLVEPAEVPGLFTLSAQPGSRRAPQPAALLLNARFGLPAGRYRVSVAARAGGAPLRGQLHLQGGRHGGTLAAWELPSSGVDRWSETFDLPVDISFVGFRASADLAATVGDVRITPQRVVPLFDRTAAYEVLGSNTLGERFVFLHHDGASYPEHQGFWVRGESSAFVSVLSRTGRLTMPVEVKIRNGPVANTVHILTPAGATAVTLAPGEIGTARLAPTSLDGTLRMIIRPETSFVPAEHEPGNRDTRRLGCWIEVIG